MFALKKYTILLALCLTASGAHPVFAQWQRTTGTLSAPVTALTISGDTLFAGSAKSSIYRSTDLGGHWSTVYDGGVYAGVSTMYVHGANVFAGITNGGVCRSTDGGTIWDFANSGLTTYVIRSFASIGATMFVGTDRALFMSSDQGTHWVEQESLPANTAGYVLASVKSTLYAGSGRSIFRSFNSGATWFRMTAGLPDTDLVTLSIQDTTVYALMKNNVLRWRDSTSSWVPVRAKATFSGPLAVQIFKDTVLIATSNSIYRLIGDTSVVKQLTGQPSYITGLRSYGSLIFAGSNNETSYGDPDGVWRSTNRGTTWQHTYLKDNAGYEGADALCLVHGILVASGNYYYHSSDHGTTWQKSASNSYGNSNVVAVGSSLFSGNSGVQRSTDYGDTWTSENSGLTNTQIGDLEVLGNDLFFGNQFGVWRLDVSSEIWSSVNVGVLDSDVSTLAVFGNRLLLSTPSGLYRSADRGDHWAVEKNSLPASSFSTFVQHGAYIFGAFYGSGIYRTSDDGVTWTSLRNPLTSGYISQLYVFGDKIFSITDSGLVVTQNDGTTWHTINDNLPSSTWIRALAADSEYLYVATSDYWIWRRPLAGLVGVSESNSAMQPASSLSPNYPNPFSPQTTFSFTLAEPRDVVLKIFDAMGNDIATLASGRLSEGLHQFTWQPHNVPNGMYLCVLKAGSEVTRRTCVVVR